MINLNWHRSANFGDRLSKIIAEWLSGQQVQTYDPDERGRDANYMLVGSVANHADNQTIIWGAGVAWSYDYIQRVKDVPMIRGKYSKEIAEKSRNKVGKLGDPVLLLPELWPAINVYKTHKIGVIPHVVEYLGVATRYMDNKDVKVIDLCKEPYQVIQDILSCEKCISSSLHGIVASHAYGVPCEWVKFSDKIGGDGIKYLDYFSSVGIPEHDPVIMVEDTDLPEIPDYEIKIGFSINDNPFR